MICVIVNEMIEHHGSRHGAAQGGYFLKIRDARGKNVVQASVRSSSSCVHLCQVEYTCERQVLIALSDSSRGISCQTYYRGLPDLLDKGLVENL